MTRYVYSTLEWQRQRHFGEEIVIGTHGYGEKKPERGCVYLLYI